MSDRSHGLDDRLADYLRAFGLLREDPVLARLREATQQLPLARMQISVEQGLLMGLLVRMLSARRALEVGVFTGYSALCVARQLPADGQLIACDVSREWTDVARPFWAEAGVVERIDLRLGPAEATLEALIDDDQAGRFDFAFIDADKEGNARYYERCLTLLRPGGLVAIDNAFLGGEVVDPDETSPTALATRQLADQIARDPRVDPGLIPIGDGLLVACKR